MKKRLGQLAFLPITFFGYEVQTKIGGCQFDRFWRKPVKIRIHDRR
jgi:hypothetical protein